MKPIKEMLLRHLQTVVRWFVTIDHVLRRRDRAGLITATRLPIGSTTQSHRTLLRVLPIVVVFGAVYGAAMGTYGFVAGKRTFLEQLPQVVYSGTKVPLLIGFTVAISIPSFFVLNTLLGLRDDFKDALQAIVSAQAGLTVILASLFPLTLFSYISLDSRPTSYALAILCNASMFAVASVSAQILLRRNYQTLIQKNHRHRWMVRLWIFVYAFVGIQAGYVLRPFIGDPDAPTTFLRKESLENAYVKVLELIWQVANQ